MKKIYKYSLLLICLLTNQSKAIIRRTVVIPPLAKYAPTSRYVPTSAFGLTSKAFATTSFKGKNPYEILGVNTNATPEQMTSAYRLGSFKYHPDTGGSNEEFQEFKRAYESSMAEYNQSKIMNEFNQPMKEYDKYDKAIKEYNKAIEEYNKVIAEIKKVLDEINTEFNKINRLNQDEEETYNIFKHFMKTIASIAGISMATVYYTFGYINEQKFISLRIKELEHYCSEKHINIDANVIRETAEKETAYIKDLHTEYPFALTFKDWIPEEWFNQEVASIAEREKAPQSIEDLEKGLLTQKPIKPYDQKQIAEQERLNRAVEDAESKMLSIKPNWRDKLSPFGGARNEARKLYSKAITERHRDIYKNVYQDDLNVANSRLSFLDTLPEATNKEIPYTINFYRKKYEEQKKNAKKALNDMMRTEEPS